MPFEVCVKGWFAAAHQLRMPDGVLEPLHGHNWHVSVTFRGDVLDEMGVLVDFTVVQRRLDEVLLAMHDRNLSELAPFLETNPSAENVAIHIAGKMSTDLRDGVGLACVEVEEAPGCIARFRPT